jgi:hypothetical protein
MAIPVVDPWLVNSDGTPDPFAGTVDFRSDPGDLRDPDVPTDGDPVLESHESLDPEIVVEKPEAELEPAPPVTPPAEQEPEEPEVLEVEGGMVTLEKERGQWKATLTSNNGGNPQVYWGKNKNDLLGNVLKAQLNATQKIRELNGKLKFGTPVSRPKNVPVPTPENRPLTADEIFEVKTQLESDPSLAINTLFQKSTGLSMQQLVNMAQEGRQAAIELRADAANRTFREENPDFYPDKDYKNFEMILKWLAKFKLGKMVKGEDVDPIFAELVSTGNYTAETLEEAFEDLSTDGLLIQAPKAPKQALPKAETPPPVAVQQHEPAPAPRPDSRIVNTVVRPRAATGLRTADVTPVSAPDTPKAPSAEDFDNMTDEQHQALWQAIRRDRLKSRRSN